MKKFKLILPIVTAASTCAVAAPIITSCSKVYTKVDQVTKNECLGMIEDSYLTVVGRNPDAKDACLKYKNNGFKHINNDAKSTNQVWGIAYVYASINEGTNGIIEAIGRNQNVDTEMGQIEAYSIKKILSATDERVIAVGRAANGLAEGVGRNPSTLDDLFKDFKDYVEKTLGL